MVPHEFLFGTQPIVDVVSVLPATCPVQTECELRNLVVVPGTSTAGVLLHFHLTVYIRSEMSTTSFMTLLPPWHFFPVQAARVVPADWVSQVSKRVSPSRALFPGTSVFSLIFAPE